MAFITNTLKYRLIPLSEIKFSERVADMIDDNGGTFPDNLLNNIYYDGSFKLDQGRLDSIMGGYYQGLPPISVKKELGGKYLLLNGRHRVCATIIRDHLFIPSTICD